jgi:hypothetical protein
MAKTPAQLDRDIAEAQLDRYKHLAQLAARWAHKRNPFAAHPDLHKFMRHVPKDRIGEPVDRQFWLGEVLDDIRRDAERDLSRAEMSRYERFVDLLLAPSSRAR